MFQIVVRVLLSFSTQTIRENNTVQVGVVCYRAKELWYPPSAPDVLGRIFELWRHGKSKPVRRGLSSTLSAQPLASRDEAGRFHGADPVEIRSLVDDFEKLESDSARIATLMSAWYTRAVSDDKIIELLKVGIERRSFVFTKPVVALAESLGMPVTEIDRQRRVLTNTNDLSKAESHIA